jgi:hypothetical protein
VQDITKTLKFNEPSVGTVSAATHICTPDCYVYTLWPDDELKFSSTATSTKIPEEIRLVPVLTIMPARLDDSETHKIGFLATETVTACQRLVYLENQRLWLACNPETYCQNPLRWLHFKTTSIGTSHLRAIVSHFKSSV